MGATALGPRLRAGLRWQGALASLFYGLPWLGKELEGQDEGQLGGLVRLNFNFRGPPRGAFATFSGAVPPC